MCEHCKVAYSFYFHVQYHKADCPVILADKGKTGKELDREIASNRR